MNSNNIERNIYNTMQYLATQKEAKLIDKISMEEYGIPSAVLMERAALKVCGEVLEILGSMNMGCAENNLKEKLKGDLKNDIKLLAVCGPGNNGGDAAAAARMLSEKGYNVKLLITQSPEHFSDMMKLQMDIIEKLSLPVLYISESEDIHFSENEDKETGGGGNKKWGDGAESGLNDRAEQLILEADLIIDGIFGIGLSRPVEGINRKLIESINNSKAKVVSVDVPSGINAESGQVMGIAVKADVTVTFGAMKKGLLFYPGHRHSGKVLLRDCGFPGKAVKASGIKSWILEPCDLKDLPQRKAHSNKGTYGHVLVIAGSKNMSGAAYFSAMAAYRTGAGLVKIFTDINNEMALKSLIPEALFSFYKEDAMLYEENPLNMEDRLHKELDWADAVVIGPGISKSRTADWLVKSTLRYLKEKNLQEKNSKEKISNEKDINVKDLQEKNSDEKVRPVVLDADGITLAAKWTDEEKKSLISENPYLVMTPHLREMAVYLGLKTQLVQENTYRAGTLMADYEGTLVLKDDRTVTAHGDRSFVNTRGCNGMATGGSGDVLTGIIAGFLAQRSARREELSSERIFKDAALSVLFHSLAGEKAAERRGNAGMVAGDLLDGISETGRELEGITDFM